MQVVHGACSQTEKTLAARVQASACTATIACVVPTLGKEMEFTRGNEREDQTL